MKIKLGGFIKVSDVNEGDVIEILNEGEEKVGQFLNNDGTPKIQFNFKVAINDDERTLSMNNASKRAMFHAFGDDTKMWIGQKAKITKQITKSGGKMIVLEPIIEEKQV